MGSKSILVAFLFLSANPREVSTCEELALWENLLLHVPPEVVNTKVTQLKGNFGMQELDRAGGKIISLDYFPVTIRTFPQNPATGTSFTPEQFLTYLRLNFNDFVAQRYAKFSPSEKTGFNEDSLWKSANPIGAVIHIHIPLPAGDGSVICTEFADDHWIYGTLRTPWLPFSKGYDGKHPVSGFRQVGFVKNMDGTYTYYTKGIDKISSKMQAKVAETFMKNPFVGADKLWFSLRKGIYDYIQKNGGSAMALDATPAQIHRDNWIAVSNCLSQEEDRGDDK